MNNEIFTIKNLSKTYVNKNIFGKAYKVDALKNIDLSIYENESLAVVGESGSGKTTLGRIILGTVEPSSGTIFFKGDDLFKLSKKEKYKIRQKIQMVFQDPFSSLNPKLKIKNILLEPINLYKTINSKPDAVKHISKILELVGLNDDYLYKYPANMSGGQRQRIGIARSLVVEPEFIILDEPTSSLDVSIQAQILNLLIDLKQSRKITYLFISHNLGVVRYIADRVCVMYEGMICELGKVEDIYNDPKHPYTQYLLSSVPKIDFNKKVETDDQITVKEKNIFGCPFYGKCKYGLDICQKAIPEKQVLEGREVYCFNPIL